MNEILHSIVSCFRLYVSYAITPRKYYELILVLFDLLHFIKIDSANFVKIDKNDLHSCMHINSFHLCILCMSRHDYTIFSALHVMNIKGKRSQGWHFIAFYLIPTFTYALRTSSSSGRVPRRFLGEVATDTESV